MKIDDIKDTVIMEINDVRDFFYDLSSFLLDLSVDDRVPEDIQQKATNFYKEI